MIVGVIFGLFSIANSAKILLTPKQKDFLVTTLVQVNEDLTQVGNSLDVLAKFEDELVVYVAENDAWGDYKTFFETHYDMEEESVVRISGWEHVDDESKSVPWHLSRVVQKDLPLKGDFPYKKCHVNNKDINTYIIDTGIDVSHPEFEGRATWLANPSGDKQDRDCNSHGTHCAGLVGSKTYGACKDANLFAIKVLGCDGSGSITSVIQGVMIAYKDHSAKYSKNKNVHAIVSMSLGGGNSKMLDKAIRACLKLNPHIHFTIAAGNENQDACDVSPANTPGVITVMASDSSDSKASFSNWGSCADIYSPGVAILSTIPDGKTAIYSGTSMATPLLAGILNHYLDENSSLNNVQSKQVLLEKATANKISRNPNNTPNRLVYLYRDYKINDEDL